MIRIIWLISILSALAAIILRFVLHRIHSFRSAVALLGIILAIISYLGTIIATILLYGGPFQL